MKKIVTCLLFLASVLLLEDACIMNDNKDRDKQGIDRVEPDQAKDREDRRTDAPKPPEPDAPEVNPNFSDTVQIH